MFKKIVLLLGIVLFLTGCMPSPITKNDINATKKAMINRSLLNEGNSYRINKILQKAKQGTPITIAFIGSSAFVEDDNEKSIETEVLKQFKNYIGKKANIKTINLNIFGSSSLLGNIILDKEILNKKPDIIILDYAVFDKHEQDDREAFETIIRTCLNQENEPQVIVFLNTKSDVPTKQDYMEQIAKYYNLPVIHVANSILPEISSGRIKAEEIYVDSLTYTDNGRKTLANFLINYFKNASKNHDDQYTMPIPMYSIADDAKIKIIDAKNIISDNDGSYVRGNSKNNLFKTKIEYLTKTENSPFVFTVEANNVYLIAPVSKLRPNTVEIYANDKKVNEINTLGETLFDVPQAFKIISNNKKEKVKISIKLKENTEQIQNNKEEDDVITINKKDFELWGIAYN